MNRNHVFLIYVAVTYSGASFNYRARHVSKRTRTSNPHLALVHLHYEYRHSRPRLSSATINMGRVIVPLYIYPNPGAWSPLEDVYVSPFLIGP